MYLIDSNIFLELLLNQERAEEVKNFLSLFPDRSMSITDLSVHSIGIILYRNKRQDLFNKFCLDALTDALEILTLDKEKYVEIKDISIKYSLDFEDSYQFLVSKSNNLQLISFDKDFDKVEKIRKEPKDILADDNPETKNN